MSSGSLEIVITPTHEWLSNAARSCQSRLLIGCPYVSGAIYDVIGTVAYEATRTLITRTDLRDFSSGASSLDSICNLADDGVTIKSLNNLHAKMYIFDDAAALVTSANATYPGLHRNRECGLATSDKEIVNQLAKSLESGLGGDRRPMIMRLAELKRLKGSLKAIQTSFTEPPVVDVPIDNAPLVQATYSIADEENLLAGLTGWKRLTMRGVLEMPQGGFGNEELYEVCKQLAAEQYPDNHTVPHKLRQQLQYLRDLGLVEFVSPGWYKRTMN